MKHHVKLNTFVLQPLALLRMSCPPLKWLQEIPLNLKTEPLSCRSTAQGLTRQFYGRVVTQVGNFLSLALLTAPFGHQKRGSKAKNGGQNAIYLHCCEDVTWSDPKTLNLSSGYTPLIAHPERSPAFFPIAEPAPLADWSLLSALRALVTGKKRETEPVRETALPPFLLQLRSLGCRFQGNIGSFAGVYGASIQENALLFLKEGVYDRLGSDAHRPAQLSTWLTEGLDIVREIVGPAGLKRLLR